MGTGIVVESLVAQGNSAGAAGGATGATGAAGGHSATVGGSHPPALKVLLWGGRGPVPGTFPCPWGTACSQCWRRSAGGFGDNLWCFGGSKPGHAEGLEELPHWQSPNLAPAPWGAVVSPPAPCRAQPVFGAVRQQSPDWGLRDPTGAPAHVPLPSLEPPLSSPRAWFALRQCWGSAAALMLLLVTAGGCCCLRGLCSPRPPCHPWGPRGCSVPLWGAPGAGGRPVPTS